MYDKRKTAIGFGITTLVTGALLAAPSIAMAAPSPVSSSAATSTDSSVTPMSGSWTYTSTYSKLSDCQRSGRLLILAGVSIQYVCNLTTYGPGGTKQRWELWTRDV